MFNNVPDLENIRFLRFLKIHAYLPKNEVIPEDNFDLHQIWIGSLKPAHYCTTTPQIHILEIQSSGRFYRQIIHMQYLPDDNLTRF